MIRLVIIGIVLAAVAYFVWDYTSTKAENKRLEIELTTANRTIQALDDVAQAHEAIRENERDLIDEIENAPEEHDAITAPVLLNAIERLHTQ